MKSIEKNDNILGINSIPNLILKFALPSIIALVVNSLYNIVDQIFIGRKIGMIGNAATSVIFPILIVGMAFASCIAEGGSAYLSIKLGANHKKQAARIIGNVIYMLIVVSIFISCVCFAFFKPVLYFVGATEAIYPYAKTYTAILLLGMPFALIGMGTNSLIRADGSPKYAMVSMITGAFINVVLDYIFIYPLNWGMAGAAWASVIGQIISFIITIAYVPHFKCIDFKLRLLKFKFSIAKKIVIFGMANFIIQSAITFVIIAYNNSLKYYGAKSIYGSEIPIAANGVVAKVNQIFMSILFGIGIGLQPIVGFNIGAGKYKRAKQTYLYSISIAFVCAFIAMLIIEPFPSVFVNMFGGTEDKLYKEFANFAIRAMFSSAIFLSIQIVTTNFFRAMGRPWLATISALSKFTIFLFPPLLILPYFFGVKSILFAEPVANFLAMTLSIILVIFQIKRINKLIKTHEKKSI
ncbi:MATE family efflux transporter [bacterium]|nr:MATE family efflux transporter [bacterium]